MSNGKENPDTVKARNAQPERMRKRQAQGNLFAKNNHEITNDQQRVRREIAGRREGAYAQMIDEVYKPITIESDNIAVTSDWHIPFTDEELVNRLLNVPKEYGTRDLIIAGDFWDCDDYSKFTHLAPPACFEEECENVRGYLKRILRAFTNVYICRGNHEKRWIDMNAGKMGMEKLFYLAKPHNISDDTWEKRVHITTDDHIYLLQKDPAKGMQLWLSCHPKNYRQINLSVAKDLSAKHLCNVIIAHGHQWAQGYDRSGTYHLLDGGGMFDRNALAYQRDTACNPMTRSGFYVLKEGKVIPYEGKTE